MKWILMVLATLFFFSGCSVSGFFSGLYAGAAKHQEMQHDPEADRNEKMHQQAVGQ